MKYIVLLCVLVCMHKKNYCQVERLDLSQSGATPHIGAEKLSGDGRWIIYLVNRKGFDGPPTLTIQSTDAAFTKEISNVKDAIITGDDRYVVFHLINDSVGIYNFSSRNTTYIPGISSYKCLFSREQKFIAYREKGKNQRLVVRDVGSGSVITFDNVIAFTFGGSKSIFLHKSANSPGMDSLMFVDLVSKKQQVVWGGEGMLTCFAGDNTGRRIAFIVETSLSKTGSLYYFNEGSSKPSLLVSSDTLLKKFSATIFTGDIRFSPNDKRVFFRIIPKKKPGHTQKGDRFSPNVNVWHYNDFRLQSEQRIYLNNDTTRMYEAVVNLPDRSVVRIQQESDQSVTYSEGGNGRFAVVATRQNWTGLEWNADDRPSFFLIDLKDGSRKLISSNLSTTVRNDVTFSPSGRYLIWYDRLQQNYYTYEINTGKYRNISLSVSGSLYDDKDDNKRAPLPFGMAGWGPGDNTVLVYDQYDIWQLDPKGEMPAVNLTNGYGRKHQIILRYVNFAEGTSGDIPVIFPGQQNILAAFDTRTMNNGFFSSTLLGQTTPRLLTQGPYMYYFAETTPAQLFYLNNVVPLKAKYSNVFVLRRMDGGAIADLFITKNFRSFTALSDFGKDKQLNSVKKELVEWKMYDGRMSRGILYKPASFDPQKKYPVIFHLYEKMSQGLNMPVSFGISSGRLPIGLFVNNGYLVFEPDIYYTVGYPGESAYNAVVSAADFLGRMPWVDSTKMGIQGHSFGGYEVNYLITRTNKFAAASAAAATSDLVSSYNGLRMGRTTGGISNQWYFESGQGRIGATLWEKPELYFQNSPVLQADKVVTPLLLMHNPYDEAVPFLQAVEYFTALKRLQKKVWLLEYDNEGHVLSDEVNQKDYTIRLYQFFEHYLKDMPSPKWMTQGVPAIMKGIDGGLDIDKAREPVARRAYIFGNAVAGEDTITPKLLFAETFLTGLGDGEEIRLTPDASGQFYFETKPLQHRARLMFIDHKTGTTFANNEFLVVEPGDSVKINARSDDGNLIFEIEGKGAEKYKAIADQAKINAYPLGTISDLSMLERAIDSVERLKINEIKKYASSLPGETYNIILVDIKASLLRFFVRQIYNNKIRDSATSQIEKEELVQRVRQKVKRVFSGFTENELCESAGYSNLLMEHLKGEFLLSYKRAPVFHELFDYIVSNTAGKLRERLLASILYDDVMADGEDPYIFKQKVEGAVSITKTPYYLSVLRHILDNNCIGASAYNFNLPKDSSGLRLSLNDLKGKVVLLDCWPLLCTGCYLFANAFHEKVYPHFKDNPDFAVVSVCDDKTASWEQYFKRLRNEPLWSWESPVRMTFREYINLYGGKDEPSAREIRKYHKANHASLVLLIDRNGKIFSSTVPFFTSANSPNIEKMIELIRKALAAK